MPALALPTPHLSGRLVYGAVGLAAALAAAVVFSPWLLALWLVPDLVLVGAFAKGGEGRLTPKAVPRYNAVHALTGPVAVAAAGFALGGSLVVALGLMWLSHVTLDRAMGFVLRAPDGSHRA
jgi:Domain of unknown function (DUF4260)